MNLKSFLLKKGLNPKFKGFRYVEKSIELILEEPSYSSCLYKTLLPRLAEIYKVTETSIYRDMRYCIQKSGLNEKILELLNIYTIEFREIGGK